jgi:hypothetical protein
VTVAPATGVPCELTAADMETVCPRLNAEFRLGLSIATDKGPAVLSCTPRETEMALPVNKNRKNAIIGLASLAVILSIRIPNLVI